jgi:adenylate cyclase class 2
MGGIFPSFMKEIEVKILEIDVGKVTKLLEKLKAKKEFEGNIDSVYLDTKDKSLRKGNRMLRVRQKGDGCIVTFKQRLMDDEAKVCDEYEFRTADFKGTLQLFKKLGYIECETDFRERISYRLKNSLVEINIFDNIPPFLEVESPNKRELKETVEMLGFKMSQAKVWTGKEVLEHYDHVFPTATKMP